MRLKKSGVVITGTKAEEERERGSWWEERVGYESGLQH